jgi:osmotically-inducible protein OsmY
MKTDTQLKHDIEQELRWDPMINEAQIGVTVDHGAVSLLGQVDTFAEKWAAEAATKRVSGVRTVAQDLKVKLAFDDTYSDADIAAAAASALKWDVFVPRGVTARVQNGTVTLEGQVAWNFERESAERAVSYLSGVSNVYNSISLKSEAASMDKVRENVVAALQRQATTDANAIKVETAGGKVTLSGHASSWKSIEDASSAAWAAPGVTEVIQRISIQ